MESLCQVECCDRAARTRGYCGGHYARLLRGDEMKSPLSTVQRSPGSQSPTCSIDWCDKASSAHDLCSGHLYRQRNGLDMNAPWRGSGSAKMCVQDGCSKIAHVRGMCRAHYQRWRKGADMDAPLMRQWSNKSCSVDGCVGEAMARGMCGRHYGRWLKNGEVGPPNKMTTWGSPIGSTRLTDQGYIKVKTADGWRQEHRVVAESIMGRPLWEWENVHHRNGVRSDNRPENLEVWVVPQPSGQRPGDIAKWLVEHYREEVIAALESRPGAQLAA